MSGTGTPIGSGDGGVASRVESVNPYGEESFPDESRVAAADEARANEGPVIFGRWPDEDEAADQVTPLPDEDEEEEDGEDELAEEDGEEEASPSPSPPAGPTFQFSLAAAARATAGAFAVAQARMDALALEAAEFEPTDNGLATSDPSKPAPDAQTLAAEFLLSFSRTSAAATAAAADGDADGANTTTATTDLDSTAADLARDIQAEIDAAAAAAAASTAARLSSLYLQWPGGDSHLHTVPESSEPPSSAPTPQLVISPRRLTAGAGGAQGPILASTFVASHSDPEHHSAATRIQSLQRGRSVRQRLVREATARAQARAQVELESRVGARLSQVSHSSREGFLRRNALRRIRSEREAAYPAYVRSHNRVGSSERLQREEAELAWLFASLAETLEAEGQRQHDAATRIQALQRGRATRQQLKQARQALHRPTSSPQKRKLAPPRTLAEPMPLREPTPPPGPEPRKRPAHPEPLNTTSTTDSLPLSHRITTLLAHITDPHEFEQARRTIGDDLSRLYAFLCERLLALDASQTADEADASLPTSASTRIAAIASALVHLLCSPSGSGNGVSAGGDDEEVEMLVVVEPLPASSTVEESGATSTTAAARRRHRRTRMAATAAAERWEVFLSVPKSQAALKVLVGAQRLSTTLKALVLLNHLTSLTDTHVHEAINQFWSAPGHTTAILTALASLVSTPSALTGQTRAIVPMVTTLHTVCRRYARDSKLRSNNKDSAAASPSYESQLFAAPLVRALLSWSVHMDRKPVLGSRAVSRVSSALTRSVTTSGAVSTGVGTGSANARWGSSWPRTLIAPSATSSDDLLAAWVSVLALSAFHGLVATNRHLLDQTLAEDDDLRRQLGVTFRTLLERLEDEEQGGEMETGLESEEDDEDDEMSWTEQVRNKQKKKDKASASATAADPQPSPARSISPDLDLEEEEAEPKASPTATVRSVSPDLELDEDKPAAAPVASPARSVSPDLEPDLDEPTLPSSSSSSSFVKVESVKPLETRPTSAVTTTATTTSTRFTPSLHARWTSRFALVLACMLAMERGGDETSSSSSSSSSAKAAPSPSSRPVMNLVRNEFVASGGLRLLMQFVTRATMLAPPPPPKPAAVVKSSFFDQEDEETSTPPPPPPPVRPSPLIPADVVPRLAMSLIASWSRVASVATRLEELCPGLVSSSSCSRTPLTSTTSTLSPQHLALSTLIRSERTRQAVQHLADMTVEEATSEKGQEDEKESNNANDDAAAAAASESTLSSEAAAELVAVHDHVMSFCKGMLVRPVSTATEKELAEGGSEEEDLIQGLLLVHLCSCSGRALHRIRVAEDEQRRRTTRSIFTSSPPPLEDHDECALALKLLGRQGLANVLAKLASRTPTTRPFVVHALRNLLLSHRTSSTAATAARDAHWTAFVVRTTSSVDGSTKSSVHGLMSSILGPLMSHAAASLSSSLLLDLLQLLHLTVATARAQGVRLEDAPSSETELEKTRAEEQRPSILHAPLVVLRRFFLEPSVAAGARIASNSELGRSMRLWILRIILELSSMPGTHASLAQAKWIETLMRVLDGECAKTPSPLRDAHLVVALQICTNLCRNSDLLSEAATTFSSSAAPSARGGSTTTAVVSIDAFERFTLVAAKKTLYQYLGALARRTAVEQYLAIRQSTLARAASARAGIRSLAAAAAAGTSTLTTANVEAGAIAPAVEPSEPSEADKAQLESEAAWLRTHQRMTDATNAHTWSRRALAVLWRVDGVARITKERRQGYPAFVRKHNLVGSSSTSATSTTTPDPTIDNVLLASLIADLRASNEAASLAGEDKEEEKEKTEEEKKEAAVPSSSSIAATSTTVVTVSPPSSSDAAAPEPEAVSRLFELQRLALELLLLVEGDMASDLEAASSSTTSSLTSRTTRSASRELLSNLLAANGDAPPVPKKLTAQSLLDCHTLSLLLSSVKSLNASGLPPLLASLVLRIVSQASFELVAFTRDDTTAARALARLAETLVTTARTWAFVTPVTTTTATSKPASSAPAAPPSPSSDALAPNADPVLARVGLLLGAAFVAATPRDSLSRLADSRTMHSDLLDLLFAGLARATTSSSVRINSDEQGQEEEQDDEDLLLWLRCLDRVFAAVPSSSSLSLSVKYGGGGGGGRGHLFTLLQIPSCVQRAKSEHRESMLQLFSTLLHHQLEGVVHALRTRGIAEPAEPIEVAPPPPSTAVKVAPGATTPASPSPSPLDDASSTPLRLVRLHLHDVQDRLLPALCWLVTQWCEKVQGLELGQTSLRRQLVQARLTRQWRSELSAARTTHRRFMAAILEVLQALQHSARLTKDSAEGGAAAATFFEAPDDIDDCEHVLALLRHAVARAFAERDATPVDEGETGISDAPYDVLMRFIIIPSTSQLPPSKTTEPTNDAADPADLLALPSFDVMRARMVRYFARLVEADLVAFQRLKEFGFFSQVLRRQWWSPDSTLATLDLLRVLLDRLPPQVMRRGGGAAGSPARGASRRLAPASGGGSDAQDEVVVPPSDLLDLLFSSSGGLPQSLLLLAHSPSSPRTWRVAALAALRRMGTVLIHTWQQQQPRIPAPSPDTTATDDEPVAAPTSSNVEEKENGSSISRTASLARSASVLSTISAGTGTEVEKVEKVEKKGVFTVELLLELVQAWLVEAAPEGSAAALTSTDSTSDLRTFVDLLKQITIDMPEGGDGGSTPSMSPAASPPPATVDVDADAVPKSLPSPPFPPSQQAVVWCLLGRRIEHRLLGMWERGLALRARDKDTFAFEARDEKEEHKDDDADADDHEDHDDNEDDEASELPSRIFDLLVFFSRHSSAFQEHLRLEAEMAAARVAEEERRLRRQLTPIAPVLDDPTTPPVPLHVLFSPKPKSTPVPKKTSTKKKMKTNANAASAASAASTPSSKTKKSTNKTNPPPLPFIDSLLLAFDPTPVSSSSSPPSSASASRSTVSVSLVLHASFAREWLNHVREGSIQVRSSFWALDWTSHLFSRLLSHACSYYATVDDELALDARGRFVLASHVARPDRRLARVYLRSLLLASFYLLLDRSSYESLRDRVRIDLKSADDAVEAVRAKKFAVVLQAWTRESRRDPTKPLPPPPSLPQDLPLTLTTPHALEPLARATALLEALVRAQPKLVRRAGETRDQNHHQDQDVEEAELGAAAESHADSSTVDHSEDNDAALKTTSSDSPPADAADTLASDEYEEDVDFGRPEEEETSFKESSHSVVFVDAEGEELAGEEAAQEEGATFDSDALFYPAPDSALTLANVRGLALSLEADAARLVSSHASRVRRAAASVSAALVAHDRRLRFRPAILRAGLPLPSLALSSSLLANIASPPHTRDDEQRAQLRREERRRNE